MTNNTTFDSMNPLVSVHLLTYNHAKFIHQSIESVLSQKTTFDFEIIIGDDCSTDGTSAIVDEYASKFPEKIKVVRGEKNGGPQPNSIRILENCRGKYMSALEGDDYWTDPHKLQKQADFMEKNPNFTVCFTNCQVEFFDQSQPSYLLNHNLQKDVFTIDDMIGESEIWFMGTASLFFRFDAIWPTRPWFPKVKSGDIPMIMLASRFGNIKYLPDVTAAYRRHAAGASNSDHKDDAVFLKNRIFMYSELDKDTDYKYHDRFKRNLGGWYYLLINSKQYKDQYWVKLALSIKYVALMFPRIDHLKVLIRDQITPKWILSIKRTVRRLLGYSG